MAGLLSDVLPFIYSRSNALKRNVNSLLDAPFDYFKQGIGQGNDDARVQNGLLAAAVKEKGYGPANQALQNQTSNFVVNSIGPLATTGVRPNVVFNSVSDKPEKWASKQNFYNLADFEKVGDANGFGLYHKPAKTTSRAGYDPTMEGHGYLLAVDKNGQIVGDTFYGPWNGDRASNAIEGAVEVHPDFRRQGIASSMYDQIEAMTGLKMKPAPTHTPLAEAFWQSRNGQPVNQLQKFVYPQEQALLTAQRNAALPVEQGGLGLHPNNTPMERAQAMGFDTDLLHGTKDNFNSFDGQTWATQDPAIADIYANANKSHLGGTRSAGPNIMPITSRGKLLEVSDMQNGDHGYFPDNLQSALDSPVRRGNINRLPAAGYDGAKITDMTDLGGVQDQFVFPKPSVLRSRFAAFDPTRINENDLLAGLLPLSSLADQDTRNKLAGLLQP